MSCAMRRCTFAHDSATGSELPTEICSGLEISFKPYSRASHAAVSRSRA